MAKTKKTKTFNVDFYANMNWFDVAEQPKKMQDLPDAFTEAQKLWKSKKTTSHTQVIDLLSPYIKARFVLDNLSKWDSFFAADYGTEVEAFEVRIVELDFASSPIPKCKAEAKFTLSLLVDPEKCDFDLWQEEHSNFYDGVSFYWDIERNEKTEGLDFTFGDNQGVECIPATQKNTVNTSNPSSSNLTFINLIGLSPKDRGNLIEFLVDLWTDEVKNIEAIKAGSGSSVTIEISDDDNFLLSNALAMKDFDKFFRKD